MRSFYEIARNRLNLLISLPVVREGRTKGKVDGEFAEQSSGAFMRFRVTIQLLEEFARRR